MLQAGRIVNVHLPKDRVTQSHQGYGFVEFISEDDAEYASRIMNGIRLFGKPIRVNKASADKQKSVEIGAELFVGNLDPMVSEQVLYDTFSRFGNLVSLPKVRFISVPVPFLVSNDTLEWLTLFIDRSRRQQLVQRLWLRIICRLRIL